MALLPAAEKADEAQGYEGAAEKHRHVVVEIAVVGVQIDARLHPGDYPGAAEMGQGRGQEGLHGAELWQQVSYESRQSEQADEVIHCQAHRQSPLGEKLPAQIKKLDEQAAQAVVVVAQGQLYMGRHVGEHQARTGAVKHLPPLEAEESRKHQAEYRQGKLSFPFCAQFLHVLLTFPSL